MPKLLFDAKNFDTFSSAIITKPELFQRLIKVNHVEDNEGHVFKVMGHAIGIGNFSFCFFLFQRILQKIHINETFLKRRSFKNQNNILVAVIYLIYVLLWIKRATWIVCMNLWCRNVQPILRN